MPQLDGTDYIFSIILTWVIGLAPPIFIRYVLWKAPLKKWPSIAICTVFWFVNIVIFIFLGSQSKTHAALLLVAFVSYGILRRTAESTSEVVADKLSTSEFGIIQCSICANAQKELLSRCGKCGAILKRF